MFGSVIGVFDVILAALRPAVFAVGVLTAVAALASYGVRTRKIPPFSALARFIRERIDPWLIAPMERRLLRAGGTPYAAPWWTLAAVIVGGLLLISGVGFLRDQLAMLAYATQSGSILFVLVRWTFGLLQVALFARVISSWVGGSPYSKWWRWSYVITEPILAPLRRVIPNIGMFDITIIVAYFGLQLLESVILRAL
ncbi:MAG: YggT family protein [Gemmatimonadaceae bacterium]|nr:YggT family protein [Gemmatimonadaceae bacterium]